MKTNKIPKIIHYCWFGGKMNFIMRQCVSTFKKLANEEKIICWDENCLSTIKNKFVNEQIKKRNWAFVSDYVRLYALYKYGGIYLDTDIEVKKKLPESFFKEELIIGYSYDNIVCTAFIMVKPQHPFIKYLLDKYETYDLPKKEKANNRLFTQSLMEYFPNFVLDGRCHEFALNSYIYPRYYFDSATYRKEGGFTIHHGMGTWKNANAPIQSILKPLVKYAKFYIKPFAVWYMNRINEKKIMNSGYFSEIYKKNVQDV